MQNLRLLRQKKGYSQAQLAKLCGVYQPTYSNWESHKFKPSLTHLQKLAEALDVSMDKLTESKALPAVSIRKTKEPKSKHKRNAVEHDFTVDVAKVETATKKVKPIHRDAVDIALESVETNSFNGISEAKAMDTLCEYVIGCLKDQEPPQKLIGFFTEALKRIRVNL